MQWTGDVESGMHKVERGHGVFPIISRGPRGLRGGGGSRTPASLLFEQLFFSSGGEVQATCERREKGLTPGKTFFA